MATSTTGAPSCARPDSPLRRKRSIHPDPPGRVTVMPEVGGRERPARRRLGLRPLSVPATLGVGGDEDAGMEDLDEPCSDDDLDGLPGEGRSHPIAEAVRGRSSPAGRPSG